MGGFSPASFFGRGPIPGSAGCSFLAQPKVGLSLSSYVNVRTARSLESHSFEWLYSKYILPFSILRAILRFMLVAEQIRSKHNPARSQASHAPVPHQRHESHTQHHVSPFFSHSSALFCTHGNGNSFRIYNWRTLVPKTWGVGGNALPALDRQRPFFHTSTLLLSSVYITVWRSLKRQAACFQSHTSLRSKNMGGGGGDAVKKLQRHAKNQNSAEASRKLSSPFALEQPWTAALRLHYNAGISTHE